VQNEKEDYKSFFNEDTSSHKNDGLELKGLVFILVVIGK